MYDKIIMDTNVAVKAATLERDCRDEDIRPLLRQLMGNGLDLKMYLKNMGYILSFWIWIMQ